MYIHIIHTVIRHIILLFFLDPASTRGPASKCGMTDVAGFVSVYVGVNVAGNR